MCSISADRLVTRCFGRCSDGRRAAPALIGPGRSPKTLPRNGANWDKFPIVDPDRRSEGALRGALEQLLRPLCRLLLRHSVSFSAFADMAKRVYVDVALKDFSLPGKKPTTSRVAVLSG